MTERALFLDRDGILNRVVMRHKVSSPWLPHELELIEEAAQVVGQARRSGFRTIVVTNQPDVSKGHIAPEALDEMHRRIREFFQVDEIEVCTSADDGDFRRKPNPGMLVQSAQRWGISLSDSFFVGDGEKDLEAGRRAGVTTILLQTDYNRAIHGTADHNLDRLSDLLPLLVR